MDNLTALKTLRLLQTRVASTTPRRQALIRVASRWLLSTVTKEYDQMLRLQVLEGAAGVPEGTWWKKGRRGFKPAADTLSGFSVHPDWFNPGQSKMGPIVGGVVGKIINDTGVPLDDLDIVNNALMGLPLDSSNPKRTKRPAYETGRVLSGKILSGKETPASVAKGKLSTYLFNKVLNEQASWNNDRNRKLPQDDEGRDLQHEDRGNSDMSPGNFLVKLITRSGDPLGKKVHKLMRRTWDQDGRTFQVPMLHWLDQLERGHLLTLTKLAAELGKSKQWISQQPWKQGWVAFFDAFWKDTALRKDIILRLEEEGIPASLGKKPTLADVPDDTEHPLFPLKSLFMKKPKKGSQHRSANRQMVERITTKWLDEHVEQTNIILMLETPDR